MIAFFFEEVDEVEIPERFEQWVKHKVARDHELTYIFCNDEHILDINRKYLNHDYYTDIITFDLSDEQTKNKIEGDIFVSLDTVKSNAKLNNASFKEELTRVMSHGILHLLGYNDKEENDKAEMRHQESLAIDFILGDNK